MANPQIKFHKVASMPTSNLQIGAIYFDTTLGTINIATSATTYDEFGHGVRTVDYKNQVLTLVKANGEEVNLNFSDVASASALTDLANIVGKEAEGENEATGLVKKVADNTAAIAENAEAIEAIEADYLKSTDKTELSGAINTEKERAEGIENGLKDRLDIIEGEADGSIKKAVADAKSALLGDAAEDYNTLGKLEDKIQAVSNAAKTYEIKAVTENLGTNIKEAYALFDGAGNKAGAQINIYKDSALQKVELIGQELQFTYLLADGTEDTVGVDVSTFLAESEFKNGLQVADHVVSVKVDPTSEFLSVSEDGVKVSGVQDAIDNTVAEVIELLDAEVTSTDGTKVTVKVTEADGKITAVNVTETDIASAQALADEIDRATTAEGKALTDAKAYADGLAVNYATAAQGEKANSAIQTAEGDQYVSATAANNKITVATHVQPISAASTSAQGLAEASDVKAYVDGKVSAKNVSAVGESGDSALVSASAVDNVVTVTSTNKLQTAVGLAETALQKADITTGTANGTIAVEGTDVEVKGLGSAAYTESTAYDAAGTGATEAGKVLGTADDTADTNTVYGVKAYVTTALTWVEFE